MTTKLDDTCISMAIYPNTHNRLVVGSNPAEPTFRPGQNKKSQVLEGLGDLKNLLELLVGPELRRKLEL